MDFYFVHSYAFTSDDQVNVMAISDYGIAVTAAIQKDHIFGTQFHPEKSAKAGQQILKNFIDFVPC
jgi:glutamine amidotransferase